MGSEGVAQGFEELVVAVALFGARAGRGDFDVGVDAVVVAV
jgi:hypothetical protein